MDYHFDRARSISLFVAGDPFRLLQGLPRRAVAFDLFSKRQKLAAIGLTAVHLTK